MQQFDVVVVGGGPAGGQCARSLAKVGRTVLLVERHKNFDINSFSSAGTPLQTLSQYDLPDSIVGSFWHKFVVVTSNQCGVWEARSPLGVVLDFAKLRSFLANDAQTQGSEVWMNARYVKHWQREGQTLVSLKRGSEEVVISTRVLVDATGPCRTVMYDKGSLKPDFLTGTGIEYLIEVEPEDYQRHADALTFFLGYKWMPKGYSWIFPMEPNQLKVGAGIINQEHQYIQHTEPLKHYIQLIIDQYMQTQTYTILDVHGSTLKYSRGLQDVYYRDNVVAIGDAVSTVNFLGGEGIRHAMQGAEIASKHIQDYLDGKTQDFKGYQTEMHQIFLHTWNLAEKFGMKKYLQDSDNIVDKVVTYLKPLSLEDVVDILFFYRFEKVSKGLPGYILRKLKFALQKLVQQTSGIFPFRKITS
ncbi:MAG: NAD(P)/FAD-dependent oxidoreductase [Leptolyngbyaceae cyanobacterium RU_5_1]|nr:NAD(P)/FAD-dependent oxidoreductase [Leptolyngbyaceae cyanobacterium RU_5_1]